MPFLESLLIASPLFAAIVLLMLATGLHGTTLTAPRNWAIVAMLCVASAILLIRNGVVTHLQSTYALRYLVGITTFAPFMSLLGAKRPQHAAWQFVVFTMLVVLALPAISGMVYGTSNALILPGLISLLIWILIAFQVINFLATGMAIPALGIVLGQMMILCPTLPGTGWLSPVRHPGAIAGIATLASVMPALLLLRFANARFGGKERSLLRLRRDFRALFGTTWSLRVMMIFNNGAEQNRWPCHLGWAGLERVAPTVDVENAEASASDAHPVEEVACDIDAETAAAMSKSLRMLLRRFVSPEWIDERWDGDWEPTSL